MRAERLFRSPQLFRRNRPKIPCTWPNNPTRPASFLRQFSPQHSPVARLFARPNAPVLPRRRPFFARRAPGWKPGLPRFCPGPRRPRTPLGPWKPRVYGFFARPRPLPPAVRRPNARRLPRPPSKQPRRAPPARPLPPPAPEGQPAPRRGTALGLATPTAEVGFPASPWRSVRPQGGIRSLDMTGKRPPLPLA